MSSIYAALIYFYSHFFVRHIVDTIYKRRGELN